MNQDIYNNLNTIKDKLTNLQDARDSVTGGLYRTTSEKERNVSDLMTEVGRFLEIIDLACTSVDDALDELDRLNGENEELRGRGGELEGEIDSLGEQIEDLESQINETNEFVEGYLGEENI